MTAIVLDFNTLWTFDIPTPDSLDTATLDRVQSALSGVERRMAGLSDWSAKTQKIHSHLALSIKKALSDGEQVDFEKYVSEVCTAEYELRKSCDSAIGELKKTIAMIVGKFPWMRHQTSEIFENSVRIFDESVSSIRSIRFLLMALEAQAEDDGSGEIMRSTEDIERSFANLA
ncbi:MAG: hypothetical protein HQL07_18825 [Nitrospirae bacterium]|nr:hypothetical protein [Magnetococcales bacterium]HAT49796.1 hypothetical protein [Alphaproteobacteria bacterium]